MTLDYSGSSPDTLAPGDGEPNHVLVMDVSVSMNTADIRPSRLEAQLDAAAHYVGHLIRDYPSSRIAAVCFSKTARLLSHWIPIASIRDLGLLRTAWLDACRAFSCGGTAIGAGLLEALLLTLAAGGPTQVVLLTDGHHNVGADPRAVAAQLTKVATLAAVGIGGTPSDVDEHLLTSIASRDYSGFPRYRWIADRGALLRHCETLAGCLTRE